MKARPGRKTRIHFLFCFFPRVLVRHLSNGQSTHREAFAWRRHPLTHREKRVLRVSTEEKHKTRSKMVATQTEPTAAAMSMSAGGLAPQTQRRKDTPLTRSGRKRVKMPTSRKNSTGRQNSLNATIVLPLLAGAAFQGRV